MQSESCSTPFPVCKIVCATASMLCPGPTLRLCWPRLCGVSTSRWLGLLFIQIAIAIGIGIDFGLALAVGRASFSRVRAPLTFLFFSIPIPIAISIAMRQQLLALKHIALVHTGACAVYQKATSTGLYSRLCSEAERSLQEM